MSKCFRWRYCLCVITIVDTKEKMEGRNQQKKTRQRETNQYSCWLYFVLRIKLFQCWFSSYFSVCVSGYLWFTHVHATVSLCMQKPREGIRVFLDSSLSTALRQNLSLRFWIWDYRGVWQSVNPSDPYHTVPTSQCWALCCAPVHFRLGSRMQASDLSWS